MTAENAIRALKAIESLNKLMDLYDKYDQEEEPKVKKRKVYVKSQDVEAEILKNITWTDDDVDDDTFCPFTRDKFEELYKKLASKLKKRRLVLSHISLRMRLALTLRYLVSGDTHETLQKISHISRKCTLRIIPDMMEHIVDILQEDYLKLSTTEDAWYKVSNDFATYWDFPHTLGVLDARHFYNRTVRTESSSLILLSVLDAHSRFQHIEIIENSTNMNVAIYKNSRLYEILKNKRLNIPPAEPLNGQTEVTPYFFVASDIFNIDRFILRSYDENMELSHSQQAFNYRINRAKTPAQMAFDIMFYKFKIFEKLCEMKMCNVKLIIKTCCILHNYLKQKITKPLDYNEHFRNSDTSGVRKISQQISEACEKAYETRENVCNYCANEGNIEEQWKKILKAELGEVM